MYFHTSRIQTITAQEQEYVRSNLKCIGINFVRRLSLLARCFRQPLKDWGGNRLAPAPRACNTVRTIYGAIFQVIQIYREARFHAVLWSPVRSEELSDSDYLTGASDYFTNPESWRSMSAHGKSPK